MEQRPKKRHVPNPHVLEKVKRAVNDPRLSEEQRDKARARLHDLSVMGSKSSVFCQTFRDEDGQASSELKPILLYAFMPSILFCIAGAVIPAFIIFSDAAWEWIIHDKIMAIGVFERGIMRANSMAEVLFEGIMMGFLFSVGFFIYRWLNGHWPNR